MTRRLAATVVLACGLVLGCTKSNDPPADAGNATGPVPKKSSAYGYDKPGKGTTTRTP